MATPTTTYDRSYLTDPAKVGKLASWVLRSENPVAAMARDVMNTGINTAPTPQSLRKVFVYLFGPRSDAEGLIRAYLAETAPHR